MKILLISRNFPPLVGGMERLMLESARELARSCELSLVGPAGCRTFVPPGLVQVAECALRPLPRFFVAATWHALRLALRLRPDWVLAGSGLTGLPAWLAARTTGARFGVFVHGLDLVATQPMYRAAFLPALRRADRVIANSRYTAELASRCGILEERIRVIHPGVTLPSALADRSADRSAARRALALPEDVPLLLTVGRLTERKGIAQFISQALPSILAHHPRLQYLVVGAAAHGALAGADATLAIEQAAARAVPPGTVRLLGGVDDTRLSQLYSAADVFVFPILERPGDVEGFGMAALEAAAHGLPTVAFAVGGVPDAVAAGRSGRLVAPENYIEFAQACDELLTNPGLLRDTARQYAADFAWPLQGQRLRETLSSVGP